MTKQDVKKIMAGGNGQKIAAALREYWKGNGYKSKPADKTYEAALEIFGAEPAESKQMSI